MTLIVVQVNEQIYKQMSTVYEQFLNKSRKRKVTIITKVTQNKAIFLTNFVTKKTFSTVTTKMRASHLAVQSPLAPHPGLTTRRHSSSATLMRSACARDE